MWIVATVVVAALSGGASLAQDPSRQPKAPDPLAVARGVMESARYCTLVTFGDDGYPHARTMDAFAPEANLVVWMATNPKSRKVEELRRNPRVALHFFDPSSMATVTLLGLATLVEDPAEKAKRWKDDWKEYYPDRDASYLLIAMTPERVEILSPAHGFPNDPITWAPRTVRLPVRR